MSKEQSYAIYLLVRSDMPRDYFKPGASADNSIRQLSDPRLDCSPESANQALEYLTTCISERAMYR